MSTIQELQNRSKEAVLRKANYTHETTVSQQPITFTTTSKLEHTSHSKHGYITKEEAKAIYQERQQIKMSIMSILRQA
jgi:hypothetical protein